MCCLLSSFSYQGLEGVCHLSDCKLKVITPLNALGLIVFTESSYQGTTTIHWVGINLLKTKQ